MMFPNRAVMATAMYSMTAMSHHGGSAPNGRSKSTRKYVRQMERIAKAKQKAEDKKKPKLKPGQLPLP
jgi:hypothetical protein